MKGHERFVAFFVGGKIKLIYAIKEVITYLKAKG